MISNDERDAVLGRLRPPMTAIDAAVKASLGSPCFKSKRGVVLFSRQLTDESVRQGVDPGSWTIVSEGFNGPPHGFVCEGKWSCESACAKICVHAEDRAIRESRIGCGENDDLELVHVKTVEGILVPGGGPSCWQCSRTIADVGIHGVWLFEAQKWHTEIPCESCSMVTIVKQGDGTNGVCERCRPHHRRGLLELGRAKQIYDVTSGVWRYYTALEFHIATLKHCALPYQTIKR